MLVLERPPGITEGSVLCFRIKKEGLIHFRKGERMKQMNSTLDTKAASHLLEPEAIDGIGGI